MLSYRGRTFCAATNCVNFGTTCPHSLTDEVKADAAKWWGNDNAPICKYSEPETLDCYEPKLDMSQSTNQDT